MKTFLLQKNVLLEKVLVTSPARKCLQGTLFGSDEQAYQEAWKNSIRYGQTFIIQTTFKKKLLSWPKLHAEDTDGSLKTS